MDTLGKKEQAQERMMVTELCLSILLVGRCAKSTEQLGEASLPQQTGCRLQLGSTLPEPWPLRAVWSHSACVPTLKHGNSHPLTCVHTLTQGCHCLPGGPSASAPGRRPLSLPGGG